jgi:hypothetical protein
VKHYLVTLHQPNIDPDSDQTIDAVLTANFDHWAAEADQGLYFISSPLSAHGIREIIGSSLDIDLADTLYVFELGGDWSPHGTTDVAREIAKRVPLP